jgi:hypothetical protein
VKPLKNKDNPFLIGKRDINKGQINFYSLEKEIALGRQLAAQVDRESMLVKTGPRSSAAHPPRVMKALRRSSLRLGRHSSAAIRRSQLRTPIGSG